MAGVREVCLLSRMARPGMGDLVQRNIFLAVLAAAYPQARLTWVVGAGVTRIPYQHEVVRHHSTAHEILLCPDAEDADPAAWAQFLDTLAARRFDVCVVDPSSPGLGVREAAAAGIPVRVAVPFNAALGALITHPIRLRRPVLGRSDLYDYAVALAAAVGVQPLPRPAQVVPRIPFRPAPLPAWAAGRPLVGVHPGGAKGWHRRWPIDRFAEIALRLATEHRAEVVLVGAPDETDEVHRIRDVLDRGGVGARAHLSLGDPLNTLLNLVDAMDLLVGNDSGPEHLAAAVGTPTVVVYGPTGTESMWARVYPLHRGVNKHRPCQNMRHDPTEERAQCEHGCPCFFESLDGPTPLCLTDITVDEVWLAVQEQLRGVGQTSRGTAPAP